MRIKAKKILTALVMVGALASATYAYDAPYDYAAPPADNFRTGQTDSAKFSLHNGSEEKASLQLSGNLLFIKANSSIYMAPKNNITAVFEHNGYMGIGRSSAEYTLDLNATNSGLNIRGSNSRIYFGGRRAIEGLQDGTSLQIGESYKDIYLRNANNVGIGTMNPSHKLTVAGQIAGTDIILSDQQNNWADHVFEKGYDLMPISKLEKFVKRNKHLPNVPSEKEIKKKAIGVAKMQGRLLEKVEELSLYVIQLSNKIDVIEKENLKLRKKVKKLEKKR
jgi:hypothetical protein